MNFPDDVDGDVLRRMEESGMQFDVEHVVDFNIDLDNWPPNPELLTRLADRYGPTEVFEPDGEFDGYIQVQLTRLVTHDLVVRTQQEATAIAAPFGGICESWGVLSAT